MRLRIAVLLVLVFGSIHLPGFAVASKNPALGCSQEAQNELGDVTADSSCGDPKAWTAIKRLPAVRLVVFDPMTDSFGFVTPCLDSSNNLIPSWNQEFLDRQRLALTTQKIRVLILPYLGSEGEVVIEGALGKGSEFAEIPGLRAVETAGVQEQAKNPEEPQAPPTSPKPATKEEEVKQLINKPKVQKIIETIQSIDTKDQVNSGQVSNQEGYQVISKAVTDIKDNENNSQLLGDQEKILGFVQGRFEVYYRRINVIRVGIRNVQDEEVRSARHVRDLPMRLRTSLIGEGGQFGMIQDATICEIAEESVRRKKAIAAVSYNTCFPDERKRAPKELGDFEFDLQKIGRDINDSAGQIDKTNEILDGISRNLEQLNAVISAKRLDGSWKKAAELYRDQLQEARSYQDSLASSVSKSRVDLKALDDDHDKIQQAVNSIISRKIRRLNYSPLHDDESITLKASLRKPDGHRSDTIAQLEVKSAPVASIRFTSGLVVSNLRNPSFEAGPAPPTSSAASQGKADSTSQPKVIQFKDEGNRQILPVFTVYHYWGRRSSLLSPTWFERLMPTLSVGIPLAKTTGLTDQVLFGLNWEASPGISINIGAHYGQVNALNRGFQVGQSIPDQLDVSTIQRKRFESAFYFGVIMNSDIFKTLQNRK